MMKFLLTTLAFFLSRSCSFQLKNAARTSRLISFSPLSSSKIDILAREIELTETLKVRVDSKIGKVVQKLGVEGIISTSVVLRVHKNPSEEKHSQTTKKVSQIAECTVVLKGGAVVHTSERSEDMYASIDLVSHKLAQKLKRHKDKVQSKRKNVKVGGNMTEDEEDMFDDEELLEDLNIENKKKAKSFATPMDIDADSVRQKVFDMPPITLSEAISSLERVDHPFFVFRNAETTEVNVVYKKDDGGVGHISPLVKAEA